MVGPERTLVWDPLVRVFHWVLVIGFFTAYLIEPEDSPAHVWAGYVVLAVVLFRILWGFAGSRYARFSDFAYSPSVIFSYLKDAVRFRAKRYIGHSPGGGAMVFVLLLALLATTVTGLMAYGADQHAGPLAGWMAGMSEPDAESLEEVHEVLANFTLGLIVLHLIGVAVASLSHRENLVRAMFTGYKRKE